MKKNAAFLFIGIIFGYLICIIVVNDNIKASASLEKELANKQQECDSIQNAYRQFLFGIDAANNSNEEDELPN